jgi:hypothetical protein
LHKALTFKLAIYLFFTHNSNMIMGLEDGEVEKIKKAGKEERYV